MNNGDIITLGGKTYTVLARTENAMRLKWRGHEYLFMRDLSDANLWRIRTGNRHHHYREIGTSTFEPA